MSFSGTISNAMTGLSAAARAADLVSSNISNAMTEGYGRKTLDTTARYMGGVQINGVVRHTDPSLSHDLRQAKAETGANDTTANFLSRLEGQYGIPGEPGALNTIFSELDARLISASSNPGSEQRLEQVQTGARDLAEKLNSLSSGIQSERKTAESKIGSEVDALNAKLEEVHKLNTMIAKSTVTDRDASSLQDVRQKLVDDISSIIPIREVERQNGKIALFTNGGAIILDSSPAKFEFTVANEIVPHMTYDNGLLSGLTVGGKSIDVSANGPISGGSLAANFDIRDNLAVAAQADLDAAARDLIERFQSSSTDPTLGPLDAGLFTDGVGAFDIADQVGISSRLGINPAVDSSQGGDIWRIRDGIAAAAEGPPGNADLLNNYQEVLSNSSMAGFGGSAGSMLDVFTNLTSGIALAATELENQKSYSNARLSVLQEQAYSDGVDTDQELQTLMSIETSFAANARVLQVVDDLMQTILGM